LADGNENALIEQMFAANIQHKDKQRARSAESVAEVRRKKQEGRR
jgi:hypothetical protein